MLEYNIKNKGMGTLGNFLQPLDLKEKIPEISIFSGASHWPNPTGSKRARDLY